MRIVTPLLTTALFFLDVVLADHAHHDHDLYHHENRNLHSHLEKRNQVVIAAGCTATFQTTSWTTCGDLIALKGLTLAQFYQWNPSVGADCSAFVPGGMYCLRGREYSSSISQLILQLLLNPSALTGRAGTRPALQQPVLVQHTGIAAMLRDNAVVDGRIAELVTAKMVFVTSVRSYRLTEHAER
jgi:hypothetical protein